MSKDVPPQFCWDWSSDFFNLGWWLVVVGFACGVIYVSIDLLAKLKAAKALRQSTSEAGGGLLDAVKGIIEALSKAPPWFALFAAGLALIWIAASVVPQACAPNHNKALNAPVQLKDSATGNANDSFESRAESGG